MLKFENSETIFLDWLHSYSLRTFITEVKNSIILVTTIYHTFSIYPVSDLSLDWVVYNNSCFPDSHLARWDQNVWRRMRILHTFYVIIFLINLTWAVSVVALTPQPRRLAVRLGGEKLVWGSSVFAVIPGASGNQFYNPHIIYSVSPFKSQLLKLFGASWKLLWKLGLANNFSVVIQPYLLFIVDTWTDWSKYVSFCPSSLKIIVNIVSSFRHPRSSSGFLAPDVLVGDVHHEVKLCKLSAGLLLRRLPRRLRNTKHVQVANLYIITWGRVTWYKLATLEFFRKMMSDGDFPLWLIFPHIYSSSYYSLTQNALQEPVMSLKPLRKRLDMMVYRIGLRMELK